MKILVTGCPRSGTLSMKNMLRSAGYDVQHERSGTEGTVSCFFFTKAEWYPREKLTWNRHRTEDGKDEVFRAEDFTHIYHLVRNPLLCIPSMAKVCGTGHQKWLEEFGNVPSHLRPKLRWAAHAWKNINQTIEHTLDAEIIRIEDIERMWPFELSRPQKILHQHKGSGTRKAEEIKWGDLRPRMHGPTIDNIIRMARRYGYDV